jgi:hypothetical protein
MGRTRSMLHAGPLRTTVGTYGPELRPSPDDIASHLSPFIISQERLANDTGQVVAMQVKGGLVRSRQDPEATPFPGRSPDYPIVKIMDSRKLAPRTNQHQRVTTGILISDQPIFGICITATVYLNTSALVPALSSLRATFATRALRIVWMMSSTCCLELFGGGFSGRCGQTTSVRAFHKRIRARRIMALGGWLTLDDSSLIIIILDFLRAAVSLQSDARSHSEVTISGHLAESILLGRLLQYSVPCIGLRGT